jgi:guanine deaminase
VFITSREDYAIYYADDRKYMTLLNFYDEIGKNYKDRNMPMEYIQNGKGLEVYQLWSELNKS